MPRQLSLDRQATPASAHPGCGAAVSSRVCVRGAAREGGPYRDQRVGVPEITLIAAAGSQRNAAYPFIMFSTRHLCLGAQKYLALVKGSKAQPTDDLSLL